MKTFKTNRVLLALTSLLMFMAGWYTKEDLIGGLILFVALLIFTPIIIEDEEY